MNTEEFINFKEQLKVKLDQIDSVTGLAFVGSAAETSRADEWSDHDFFVFARDGKAEDLRQNLAWLPDFESVRLSVRETEHGLKVIYQNGHVLEFAIFEDDWELSGVNTYEVTLDKQSIEKRLKDAQARSIPNPIDFDREFSLFLAHLLIGTGRFRRGEILSARQFINSFCVNSVVRLVSALNKSASGSDSLSDNQNPFRRFEVRHPNVAKGIECVHLMDVESAASSLLQLAVENLSEQLEQKHFEQIEVIKQRLGW